MAGIIWQGKVFPIQCIGSLLENQLFLVPSDTTFLDMLKDLFLYFLEQLKAFVLPYQRPGARNKRPGGPGPQIGASGPTGRHGHEGYYFQEHKF